MTTGHRVYPRDDGILYLQEGDYGLDSRDSCWYGRPPGHHAGSFKQHNVVEHEDGTITVSPSILLADYNDNSGEKVIWHGYLENGIWREV